MCFHFCLSCMERCHYTDNQQCWFCSEHANLICTYHVELISLEKHRRITRKRVILPVAFCLKHRRKQGDLKTHTIITHDASNHTCVDKHTIIIIQKYVGVVCSHSKPSKYVFPKRCFALSGSGGF